MNCLPGREEGGSGTLIESSVTGEAPELVAKGCIPMMHLDQENRVSCSDLETTTNECRVGKLHKMDPYH